MITVWWVLVAVACLTLVILVHEAAHALALRGLGIRVVEFGIGLLIPRLRITLPNGFTVSISPWLIGAYVRPDPDQEHALRTLNYRDSTWYSGAGIIANLVLGDALFTAVALSRDKLILALITGTGTALVWLTRRWFCAYLIPAAALPVIAWTAYALARTIGEPQGPVGAITTLTAQLTAGSLVNTMLVCGALSVGLGILNMLPLYPLDGVSRGRCRSTALGEYPGRHPV